MEKNIRRISKTLIVFLITLSIFYLIFARINFFSVVNVLSKSNISYLFLSLLPMFLSILIGIKRWQKILKTTGYSISYVRCFNIVMAAFPLTSITPSKSGEIVKAYYLKNEIPISKTIGSILTERVFDVFSLVLFSLIGMIFYQEFELVGVALYALLIIATIFYFAHNNFLRLSIKESWNVKLQSITLSMKKVTKDKDTFLVIVLYSFLVWFLVIIQTLLFFYALEIEIPFLFTMANIPIAIFIGMLPVTLGGMGTRDVAIILLFSEYSSPVELLSVGILFSLFRYLLVSLIGIPFTIKLMKKQLNN